MSTAKLQLCVLLSLWAPAVTSCTGCKPDADARSGEDRPSAAVAKAPSSMSMRPNLVIISIDTLRRDHLTMYGYHRNTSPNLQRLAATGVVFDNAIAANTNTAPSHASILTGLHTGTHGVVRNRLGLRRNVKTLASVLKEHGYVTAAFLSGWTLARHTRLHRGFDVYDMEFNGRRPAPATWRPAQAWLKQHAKGDAPFFLFLHLFDPHYPYDPPRRFALRFLLGQKVLITRAIKRGLPGLQAKLRLSQREVDEYVARYDGEIVAADRAVGRLLRELRLMGLKRRTLIVFVSDHGETLFEREWAADHGGRAYDEQIRVPLVMRFADRRRAGTRVEAQVHHVDIMPTVLDELGVEGPKKMQGRSLLPLVDGTAASPRSATAFSTARTEPLRVPEINAALLTKRQISTARLPSLKLIEYPMQNGQWHQQLFHLGTDPGERRDIAHRRPDEVKRLHLELDRWRRETGLDLDLPSPKVSAETEEALRALGYVE